MLARLSKTSGRLFDLRLEPASGASSKNDEDDLLTIDIDEFSALALPIPNIAWRRVASACGRTLAPLCNGITSMLASDVERLAQLFSNLEPIYELDEELTDDWSEKAPAPLDVTSFEQSYTGHENLYSTIPLGYPCPHVRPPRKRRRSYSPSFDHPLVIHPAAPSLPTIVITPAEDAPRETSAWVPYQDAVFGARLTVPSHPTFNAVYSHPPCISVDERMLLPKMNKWRYNAGHWHVILPSVQDQVKTGAFSRAVSSKRRHCRSSR